MSEGGIDIARVVSLIMENPKLIEEISALAKKEGDGPGAEENPPKTPSEPEGESLQASTKAESPGINPNGRNRQRLLGALKPYVSRDRAQAIDSMLSIVEILDAMKGR